MPLPLIPILIAVASAGSGLSIAYLLNSTYEGKIFDKYKEHTGVDDSHISHFYKLSPSNAMMFIGKMRWYVVNKKMSVTTSKDIVEIAKKVVADMKLPGNPNPYHAFGLGVYESIKPTDSDLYRYLRGGITDRDKLVKDTKNIFDSAGTITESATNIFSLEKYLKYGIALIALYGGVRYVLPVISKKMSKSKNV